FLWSLPVTPVPDRPALQHGSAAPTGAVAENPAQCRRPWPPALSGPGSVEYRPAVSGRLDAETHRSVRPDQVSAEPPAIMARAIARDAPVGSRRTTTDTLQRPHRSANPGNPGADERAANAQRMPLAPGLHR